jgi:hypothetical protein
MAPAAMAADVALSVDRTSTSPGVTLPKWGTVYLDIAYTGDQPMRFQAKAYSRGELAARGQAMNGAVVHPAGTGNALVWVSFSQAAEIDQIHVTAYDEAFKPVSILEVPFPARWTDTQVEKRSEPPAWVVGLREQENELAAAYQRAHPPEPDPIGDLVVTLMMFAVPGYFVVQAGSVFLMRGGWRRAALAPLVVMVPVAALTAFGLAAGSNLAPIYLVFTAPLGFLYLAALIAVRGIRLLTTA